MSTSDDSALLHLQLPARPEAASAARRALAALNGDLHLISASRLHDAQLLVTELVTNAVRHGAASSVDLRVRAAPRTLRVDVAHAGASFDAGARTEPSPERAGGWGLRIVDVVAHAWGVEGDDARTSVWFEVDRPSSEEPLELTGEAPPPAP